MRCLNTGWPNPLLALIHACFHLFFFLLLYSQSTMKRSAVGIWNCKACRKTVAGGAYVVRYVQLASLVSLQNPSFAQYAVAAAPAFPISLCLFVLLSLLLSLLVSLFLSLVLPLLCLLSLFLLFSLPRLSILASHSLSLSIFCSLYLSHILSLPPSLSSPSTQHGCCGNSAQHHPASARDARPVGGLFFSCFSFPVVG